VVRPGRGPRQCDRLAQGAGAGYVEYREEVTSGPRESAAPVSS
jgi:hypothetical protein